MDGELKGFDGIKVRIVSLLLKKYALGYLVQAWEWAKGKKTALCIVGMVLIPFLKAQGIIDDQTAETMNAAFGTGAGFSFMQKLQRYKPLVDGVVTELKKEEGKNV